MSRVIGKSLAEWIPLFVKLMNSGEEVLAGFVLWSLKYLKSKLGLPLLGAHCCLFSGCRLESFSVVQISQSSPSSGNVA